MFRNVIAEVLVPDLEPGQVVVMDNLACHKRPKIADTGYDDVQTALDN
jgi:predicted O-methyltransferase YrrM